MKTRTLLMTALTGALIFPLLQACAPVVVGGAAATGTAVAIDRRTAGTMVDDQAVELKTLDAILSDKELYEQTHISSTSFNGLVLLTGQAPRAELRERAERIVSAYPEVRRVVNEITVSAPNSVMTRTSDTWITTKVKTLMFAEKDFNGNNVKVVTENGTVYLMGLVRRAESDKAVAIARQVKGVQRVVKVFEYID
ncbi:BON domain-containing protein [Thioalbus denitrificans]|uniref:Osmotically-inducible protein OsmY n=1 Tax=Thioalbus denitrificans TaxID=547122 RepID=A0A369CJE4_9GAMM|nr:BON domain-containing protein [Thioalbus denitrificans]RCX33418.1 osmotically-inducible protein OsmY [Thioalbus denitrificans]